MTTTPQRPDDWPADDFVSTEEILRRHGARPIAAVGDLAATKDPFESDAASVLLRRRLTEPLAG